MKYLFIKLTVLHVKAIIYVIRYFYLIEILFPFNNRQLILDARNFLENNTIA